MSRLCAAVAVVTACTTSTPIRAVAPTGDPVALDAARRELATRTDELVLANARAQLDLDPTTALATLKKLDGDPASWRTARVIAAEAVRRGVARVVPVGRVHALAFSHAGTQLAAAGNDGVIRVIDVARLSVTPYRGHTAPVLAVGFAATGDAMVSVDERGEARRWNLATGTSTVVEAAVVPTTFADRAELSPDLRYVVLHHDDHSEVVELGGARHALPEPGRLATWTAGGQLETVSFEGRLEAIDLATGAAHSAPDHLNGGVDASALAWGSVRLVGGRDGAVRMTSGHPRILHHGPVTAIAATPDTIATASSDLIDDRGSGRTFVVGDYTIAVAVATPSLEEITRLRGHRGPIDALAITERGDRVASAGRDGTVRVWAIDRVAFDRFDGVDTAAARFAGPGRAVLAPEIDRLVVRAHGRPDDAFDAGTTKRNFHVERVNGKPVIVIEAADVMVRSPDELLVSDAGNVALGIGVGGHVVRWDLVARAGVTLPLDPFRATLDVKSGRVITIDKPGAIAAWSGDVATAIGVARRPSVALAARDPAIAVSYDDGSAELFGPQRRLLSGPAAPVVALAFSLDGKLLVAGTDRGTVGAWELASGAWHAWTGAHGDRVDRIVMAPDGATAISTSFDKTGRVWRIAEHASVELVGHDAPIGGVAVGADGTIYTASADRTVRAWDPKTGVGRVVLALDAAVLDVQIDGTRVHAVTTDGTIVTVDDAIPTGEPAMRAWIARMTNAIVP